MKYKAGGDLSEGSRLSKEGTYHLTITSVDEPPIYSNGEKLIASAMFRLNFLIHAGTVDGMKDKICNEMFFEPKEDNEKKKAFVIKKMDKLLVATSMMSEEEVESQAEVEFSWQALRGRQMVVKFAKGKDDYINMNFTDMWHVDDPKVKSVPKDQGALSILPKSQRRDEKNKPMAPLDRGDVEAESETEVF